MRKIVSLLLMVAVLAVTLFGCGGGVNIEGKWESAYIDASSGELGGKYKMPGVVSFEIMKDGKLIATAFGTDKIEGTWKRNGDVVSVTVDGDTMDFKIEKDVLVADSPELGGKLYLTKDIKNFKFPDDVKDLPF